MKKLYLTTILVISAKIFSYAQITTDSSTGNVGIGTNQPFGRLTILKSTAYSDNSSTASTIDNLLVIQTPFNGSAPESYNGTGYKWGIQLWGRHDQTILDGSKTAAIYAVSEDGSLGYNRAVGLALHTTPFDGASTERLRITADGKVGINTIDTKGYMLAVNGNVIATSVTVKLYSAWPDYVFKPTYYLKPLSEVKTYIDQNHHLPEMPSEKDVAEKGVDLGEMNKILVKKVEELTLYLIEQQKINQSLQKQINSLKDQK